MKIAAVAVLFAAFVGYTVYSKWQDSHFKVDPKAFNVADRFQGVLNAEYKRFPKLKLEDQFGLTKDPGLIASAPGVHRQVRIDKIGVLPYQLYVLYSINLRKTDQSPMDVPKMSFSNIVLHFASGKTLTGKAVPSPMFKSDNGKVYGHRLYRGVVFAPDMKTLNADSGGSQSFSQLKSITLKNANLIEKNKKIPLQHLAVQTSYSPNHMKLFSVPLHQKLALSNGETISFKRLDASILNTKLIFTVSPNKRKIQSINMRVGTGNNAFRFSQILQQTNKAYEMVFAPFTTVPKHLKIFVQGMNTFSNKKITLEVPGGKSGSKVSAGKGKRVFGTTFSFGGYQKSPDPSKIDLNLNWAINMNNQKLLVFQPTLYSELQQQLADASTALEKQFIKGSSADLVKITNGKGKTPSTSKGDGMTATGLKNTLHIALPRSYVDQSKKLLITISQIPVEEKVKPASVIINIPKNRLKGK